MWRMWKKLRLTWNFNRVIYLGAGPFFGLAHEAQLKILELTAGRVATMYESGLASVWSISYQ